MTSLDPRQLIVLRVRTIVAALILLGLAWFASQVAADAKFPFADWIAPVAALMAVVAVWRAPQRRFASWSYQLNEDELVVRHGIYVRTQTVVPFGRVQHIDLAQPPLSRALGLAILTLNTAGTQGAAVRLPGLDQAAAEEMRTAIRQKIREDLV